MKIFYIFLIIGICINGYSQTSRSAQSKISKTAQNKINKAKTSKNTYRAKTANNRISHTNEAVKPRETVTEKYLKGPSGKKAHADSSASRADVNKSPFVGGIHAAPNAEEKFDTTNKNINNIQNVNNVNNDNVIVAPIAAPNDTIFNANTITDNSVPTNSGAVDRSGQAQFGQTNWGNSRSTVGESQWTIPPPVTASFSKEFPTVDNTTWSRDNKDTSIYLAKYKWGDTWITSTYSVTGRRLDMKTEVQLTSLPQPVSAYISKLPNRIQVTAISKWQVLGKADVYEIQTRTGKTMYVNKDGKEISY